MKKLLASVTGTTLAVGALGVATAAPAAAEPWIDAWADCGAVYVDAYDYPEQTRLTVTIDDETVDDVVGGEHWSEYEIDWSVDHTWSVAVDAPDDGLDHTIEGATTPCDTDPDLYADAYAECEYLSVDVSGRPDGTRLTVTIDDETVEDVTFTDSYSTWYDLDWSVDHTWSVVVDAAEDSYDWSASGTTTACETDPAIYADAYGWCGYLEVWASGYPAGTRAEVAVDGELIDDVTFEGDLYREYDVEPVAGLQYAVTIDADDDALDATYTGTIDGCDDGDGDGDGDGDDTYGPVETSCDTIEVWASGEEYAGGGTVRVEVDGEIVESSTYTDDYFSAVYRFDYIAPHDWSVVITNAADDVVVDESGVTTPCAVEDHAVWVSTQCDMLEVTVDDPWAAGARIEVAVDDVVVGSGELGVYDETSEGVFTEFYRLDQQVGHTWQVTFDADDDRRDATVWGVTTPCWSEGEVVYPAQPEPVTECAATSADVVAPADSEGITYTVTDEGILAETNSGYALGNSLYEPGEPSWERLDDHTAFLEMSLVLRPACELDVVAVQPVCVDGEPYVDFAVTPPPGAEPDSMMIEWIGDGGTHEIVYGDAGFGKPFAGLEPWPGFVVHDDGTVSPTYDTSWRLAGIDLLLSATIWNDDGTTTWYSSVVEDAPVMDPCADDGGGAETGERQGPGNGWGAPTYPDHPGQGKAKGLHRGQDIDVVDV